MKLNKVIFILTVATMSMQGFAKASGNYLESSYFKRHAANEKEKKKFAHVHVTTEFGLYTTDLEDALTQGFAEDLYHGAIEYIPGIITEISGPPDASNDKGVLNLSIDLRLSRRWKIGVGINGIPEVQVVGYVNLDSLQPVEDYYYSKAEEIISGVTAKAQLIYNLKAYKGSGIGCELGIGGGVTYNFVNLKQRFVTNVLDTLSGGYITGEQLFSEKYSSVGAYGLIRLDVYFSKHLSWCTDVSVLYDTGIKIDETTYNFEDVQQSIKQHDIVLSGYLVATGLAIHF